MQFPLSPDEHAAMARYLSGIKRQLQEVSDLFTSRYGKGSDIAAAAVRTLASAALLEHDFSQIEEPESRSAPTGAEFSVTRN